MKIETHDLIPLSLYNALILYNELIARLEEMRKARRKANDWNVTDLIEGYTFAREMVDFFFSSNLLDEQRYHSLDEYLHYCIDCPSTHNVPLKILQIGISLT